MAKLIYIEAEYVCADVWTIAQNLQCLHRLHLGHCPRNEIGDGREVFNPPRQIIVRGCIPMKKAQQLQLGNGKKSARLNCDAAEIYNSHSCLIHFLPVVHPAS